MALSNRFQRCFELFVLVLFFDQFKNAAAVSAIKIVRDPFLCQFNMGVKIAAIIHIRELQDIEVGTEPIDEVVEGEDAVGIEFDSLGPDRCGEIKNPTRFEAFQDVA